MGNSNCYSVKFINDVSDVAILKWWHNLWACSPNVSHTAHPEFVEEVYRFLDRHVEPLLIIITLKDRPVAIFPMAAPFGQISTIEAAPLFTDYWDPLIDANHLNSSIALWIETILELGYSEIRLGLAKLRASWLKRIIELSEKANLNILIGKIVGYPRLRLENGQWSNYLNDRKRLKRALTKFEKRRDLKAHWWTVESDLDTPLDFFFTHHLKRFTTSPYHCSERRDFVRNVFRSAVKSGFAGIHMLSLKELTVAIGLWFFNGNTRYFLNGAWDSNYSYLGAGILLHTAMIKASFEQGDFGTLDYMYGREPYKFFFANEEIEVAKITLKVRRDLQ